MCCHNQSSEPLLAAGLVREEDVDRQLGAEPKQWLPMDKIRGGAFVFNIYPHSIKTIKVLRVRLLR